MRSRVMHESSLAKDEVAALEPERSWPLVGVVIPAWNALTYTLECLESLRGLDYPAYRVILVDNGSTDSTAEVVGRRYAEVTVMRNAENRGFARACNQGLAEAFDGGAEYAFLLNNDTLVAPDLLKQLVTAAELRPNGGIFGPRICYADRPETIWFTGMRFSVPVYFVRTAERFQVHALHPISVDFVSGCGMLISRQVYERIGGLNEAYFMYYEDLDYCLSAQKAGFGIVYVPDARMWHAVSVSSGGKDSPVKQYHQVKSAIIFNRRHSSGLFRVLGVGLRLAHAGWMGIKSLLRGRLSLNMVRHYARGVREATQEGSAAVSAAAAPEMVPGQCPLCDGRSLSFAFAGTDLLHETPGRFSVWECAACRLRFQFPLPSDFDALYPLDYGGYAPSARLTRSRFRGRSLQARVALLARLRPQGGRLLDVGCGSGDFLAAIAASGIWRAAGLEPNPAAARLAAKTPGITARVGDLSSPGDLAGPFDVITLWHALEHAPDSEGALRAALGLLAGHGLLVVACPMVDSAEARLFGSAWAGYDLPRHLQMHSRATMRLLASRLGLEAREVRGVIAGFNSCRISLLLWLKQRRAPRILASVAPLVAPAIYLALLPFSIRRPSVGVFVLRRPKNRAEPVAQEAL